MTAAARAALLGHAEAVTARLDEEYDARFVDRKRSVNLHEDERASLIARYAVLPEGPNGKKIGVAALEREYGRSPGYIGARSLRSRQISISMISRCSVL